MVTKRKACVDGINNDTPMKKKAQWSQKYKEDYSSKYAFISKSDKGNLYAKCTVCLADFNISHGGENDIKKSP
jgi:hypothetical protein